MVRLRVIEQGLPEAPEEVVVCDLRGPLAGRELGMGMQRRLKLDGKRWLLFRALWNSPSRSLSAEEALAVLGVRPAEDHLHIGQLKACASRTTKAMTDAGVGWSIVTKTVYGRLATVRLDM